MFFKKVQNNNYKYWFYNCTAAHVKNNQLMNLKSKYVIFKKGKIWEKML